MAPEDTAPGVAAGPSVPAIAALKFKINESAMIPVASGHAVGKGWLAPTGFKPLGVCWHWAVTNDLVTLRNVIGGKNPERKGEASAHYGIGRTFKEGVDRYVSLENRSFHAGKNQTVRHDGKKLGKAEFNDFKGSRATIGIETVHIGTVKNPPFIRTASPLGQPLRVQLWTEEQIEMMIAIGVEIVTRWPHIGVRDHHGHHDICPTDVNTGKAYKIDVAGFPFARVLRGIYPKETIPDVWTPLETVTQRQRALIALGFDLGATGADGDWGKKSREALLAFQQANGLFANGLWSTFVNWKVFEVLKARGKDLAQVGGAPV
jgi:N-acetyl-anhydromuramyl-L-alanine amidase AmpD